MSLPPGYFNDENGFVGKTITKVNWSNDSIILMFSDGSYTQLYASSGCECCEPTIEFGNPVDHELLMAGLISRREYDVILEKRRVALEEQQRETYERLKAKFEGAKSKGTDT